MPRRPIALLALALCAVLVGCWLWLGRSAPPAPVPRIDPGSSTTPDSPSTPVSATQPDGSRSTERSGSDEKHFRPDATRVEGRHELLVQTRDTGEPVAGVEVFALALPDSEWSIGGGSGPLLTADLEAYLAAHGRKETTDARGIALVPEPDETLVACARNAQLWGWTRFERGASEPAVLELAPAHDLDVSVRAADGTPQKGARVQIGGLEQDAPPWVGETDAQGMLKVRNVEALLADQSIDAGQLVRVGMLEPFDPPVERWIDPRALPAQPLELTLPACASLLVRVVARPGVALPVDGQVRLRWMSRPGGVQSLLPREDPPMLVPLVDGEARVAHVALGGRLMLNVDFGPSFAAMCSTHREIEGPHVAGEEQLVELALDPRDALLVVPLLDEAGQPLASRELEFARYEMRPDRAKVFYAARERVRTDAQGRLRRVMPRDSRVDSGGEATERSGWLWLARPGQAALAAEVDLRGPFEPGLNERPPVVLKPDAPLVQGRVLDEQDQPLANVTVALSRVVDGAPGEIPGLLPVRTDAGGEFEFHGPCFAFDLQLQAFAADHRLAPDEKLPLFRCGTSPSFEIRMQLLGRLRGRVLADTGVRASDLALRLEGAGGVQPARELRRVGSGFAIEFDGLVEGEYTLVASSPRDQGAFATIAGLTVKRGETCRDARLDPLDLRGRIPSEAPEGASNAIRVLDEQGREIDHGYAWYDAMRFPWAGGRVVLPADAHGELAVVAEHTGLARVALDAHPAEVRLPPALRARFALDVPEDLRPRGLRIGLHLGFASAADPLADQLLSVKDWLELDSAYEVAIDVGAPMQLRAGGLMAWLPGGEGKTLSLRLADGPPWEIRAADGEQRFAVQVRSDQWELLRTALAQSR